LDVFNEIDSDGKHRPTASRFEQASPTSLVRPHLPLEIYPTASAMDSLPDVRQEISSNSRFLTSSVAGHDPDIHSIPALSIVGLLREAIFRAVAKHDGLTLYCSLSPQRNSALKSLTAILRAMGVRIAFAPVKSPAIPVSAVAYRVQR
jgi:hypothetical protein